MDELARFSVFAYQLEQDESNAIVLPMTQTGRRYDGEFYVCRFCQKKFTKVASIRRHQAQYCRKLLTSPYESERPMSMQRLMGG